MGSDIDFELVLPYALGRFVPAGLLGFLMAGLLAAFMSNFAATVNAAPPYFVNDIYKRFINPNASPRTYVRLSYLSSFAVVVVGVLIGWYVATVNSVVLWIVSGLWGGYTASNVLKWYWWRFNGYGYFWGMVSGVGASLVLPKALPRIFNVAGFLGEYPVNLEVSVIFPIVLVISLIGCLAGTLLTKPEDDEVLKDFYRRVRPWGFWGPILAKVREEDPDFQPNKDFTRDMFNVVVGICWQVSLVALPIYIVIRKPNSALLAVAVVAATSVILKFTWYDRLREVQPEVELATAAARMDQ
jgi:Na+/proline symporter